MLDSLRGPRESFRESLTSIDHLMGRACVYAEYWSKKKRVQPWSILGEIFGHGSGVSSALYELYKKSEADQ